MENFDFSNTPKDNLLPDLFYNWVITEQEMMESGSNKTLCSVCGTAKGKNMITVTFKALEPAEYAGSEIMEFYTIGMDSDPCAHSAVTLNQPQNFGAINFGLLLDATGTPRNQIASLVGKRCQRATVQVEIPDRKNGGTRVVNNFAKGARGAPGVYPVGTVAVGQATPGEAYPKGGAKQSNKTNGGISNPMSAKEVPCPRCKQPFTDGKELNDHMAVCLDS